MKKIILFLILFIIMLLFAWLLLSNSASSPITRSDLSPTDQRQQESAAEDLPATTIIAEQLDTPWSLVFLPNESMLVTERPGTIKHINNNGQVTPVRVNGLEDVLEISEGGLLGMTLHPSFSQNNFVYLYYTYSTSGNNTLNRVVRMEYEDNALSNETIIVDRIPGAPNHDGGRIKFGPDGLLYIGTGDAQEPSRAQDRNNLAGKILRVTDKGQVPPGNPFGNPVYSYGHRNVQGLAFDQDGKLWATEHGRSGVQSGFDELNLIESGKNYGWSEIQGDERRVGMESPIRHSGSQTWAPSGLVYFAGSLYFTGLRGNALYEAVIQGNGVRDFNTHFAGEFGRIRDVVAGPDGMLYIITSNRDGRGSPSSQDDILVRVNPQKL